MKLETYELFYSLIKLQPRSKSLETIARDLYSKIQEYSRPSTERSFVDKSGNIDFIPRVELDTPSTGYGNTPRYLNPENILILKHQYDSEFIENWVNLTVKKLVEGTSFSKADNDKLKRDLISFANNYRVTEIDKKTMTPMNALTSLLEPLKRLQARKELLTPDEYAASYLSTLKDRESKIREALRCIPAAQIKTIKLFFEHSRPTLEADQLDFFAKMSNFFNRYPIKNEQQYNHRVIELEQHFNEKWVDIKAKIDIVFPDKTMANCFHLFFEKTEDNVLTRKNLLEYQLAKVKEEVAMLELNKLERQISQIFIAQNELRGLYEAADKKRKELKTLQDDVAKFNPLESKEGKEEKEFKESKSSAESAGSAAGHGDNKTRSDNPAERYTEITGLESSSSQVKMVSFEHYTQSARVTTEFPSQQQSLLERLTAILEESMKTPSADLNPKVQSELALIQLLLGRLQAPSSQQSSKPG